MITLGQAAVELRRGHCCFGGGAWVSPPVAADADGECKRSERSREPMPHIDVGDKVV